MIKVTHKIFLAITLLSLTACGGARNPNANNSQFPTGFGQLNPIEVTLDSSISWTPPATYENGADLPISEIGGYRIYAGLSRSEMSVRQINNSASATDFSLSGLGRGIFFIAVTCFDSQGRESGFSNQLIVNIL